MEALVNEATSQEKTFHSTRLITPLITGMRGVTCFKGVDRGVSETRFADWRLFFTIMLASLCSSLEISP